MWTSTFPIRLRPVILLLGDSLTQQGFGVNGGLGWASMLAHTYRRQADVLNRGYSGYNSRLVADIMDNIFCNTVEKNVLFATIFLGANDAALPGERQHVPLKEYKDNLETILKSLRDAVGSQVPVVFMTPPPVDTEAWKRHNQMLERDPSYRANQVSQKYGDMVKAIAARNDCLVLDVFALLGGAEGCHDYLSDGLHLSSSGNELVFEGLLRLVQDSPKLSPVEAEWDQFSADVSAVRMRPSIVLLGDSLTEFGMDKSGWASLLASSYARRADVLNRGFQGFNSREILHKVLPELFTETPADGVAFVTLWLGANDAFPVGDERHVPLAKFVENLTAVVTKIRERILPPTTPQGDCLDRLPIILITPPPIDESKSDELGLTSERNRDYADVVRAVAKQKNCLYLDVFDILSSDGVDYWTDGVHLNAKSNIMIYEALMKLIRRDLGELAPMTDGNGKYGDKGIPLAEKLWYEHC